MKKAFLICYCLIVLGACNVEHNEKSLPKPASSSSVSKVLVIKDNSNTVLESVIIDFEFDNTLAGRNKPLADRIKYYNRNSSEKEVEEIFLP